MLKLVCFQRAHNFAVQRLRFAAHRRCAVLSAAPNGVRILGTGHQRDQRAKRRVVERQSGGQPRFESRQSDFAHAGKPARRFRANAANARFLVNRFAESTRLPCLRRLQLFVHLRARHRAAAHQRFMHIERSAVTHAQRRARNAQRKDCALVRVHATRRAAHRVLRQKPRYAKRVEARRRVPAPVRKANPRTVFKIGPKRARAVDEGEHIHIVVRARVVSVHQTGFGRNRHLAEQRALRVFRRSRSEHRLKMRVDHRVCPLKERVHAVRAASRADGRGLVAEQTAPCRQADICPRNLAAVRRDDVDIQQPPQLFSVFQRAEPFLDGLRFRAHADHRFRPGLFMNGRVKQRLIRRKHRFHLRHAPRERPLDVLRPLDRPGDVHT